MFTNLECRLEFGVHLWATVENPKETLASQAQNGWEERGLTFAKNLAAENVCMDNGN